MPRKPRHKHNLRRLRELLGQVEFPPKPILQKELARRIGIPVSSLQDIELKKRRLDPELAHRISVATGCPIGWLLDPKPWGKRMPTLHKQTASQDPSLAKIRGLLEELEEMLGTRMTKSLADKIRQIPHAQVGLQAKVTAVGTVVANATAKIKT
jgi:transcriptional regulator with XRE-family HTH domain